MLLKNFVAAYQSLREACANSGPSTSTRCGRVAWRPLSQLTHCGLKTNKPSGVAWQPLSQLTHCGLKTNKPSSVPWRSLSQLTRCVYTWRPLSQLTRSSLKTNELSRCCTRWSLSPFSYKTYSAVVVSNKVKPAVSLHKNATIFSVRSATRNPCQALVTAYRNCKAMLVSICTAFCENSLQCSSSFKEGVALKERLNRRRKRDREPSRIPVKRILNVLRKKKNRKKV